MAKSHIGMREIKHEDYKEFAEVHKEITLGKKKIRIGQPRRIKEYQPKHTGIPLEEKKVDTLLKKIRRLLLSGALPSKIVPLIARDSSRYFELETTNLWSFLNRGKWATHQGDFRGNWPPQMARNIISRYSKPKETVLDQMCGSGTTLIECKLLGRNAIGVDINLDHVMLTRDRLDFQYRPLDPEFPKVEMKTYLGDATNLNLIDDEEIHLIATHPPYASIIPYNNKKERTAGDLTLRNIGKYITGMKKVASESHRVLKPGRFCAILVGDTRRSRHHVPIAFRVMQAFLDEGFILREDIVKYQWKTKTTREKWGGLTKGADVCWVDIDKEARKGYYMDFYLLFYEHLFIFRKPDEDEDLRKYRDSMQWWNKRVKLPAH